MKHQIYPVILCGGAGARLWPLSTPARPKQFLALTSDLSMIEETAQRVTGNPHDEIAFDSLMVIGAKQHADLLAEFVPNSRRILEPFGRNSAPAVAAASLAHAPEDLILILSADHDIQDVPAFHEAISIGAQAASEGAIVTFGIKPTHPATGYGYIKSKPDIASEALDVEAFEEKPDLATAQSYLADGSYYWNAGIFMFRAATMRTAFETFAPEILEGVSKALGCGTGDVIHLDPVAFRTTPSISVDYAIMEKAENVKTVPVNMGWSDVGGYRALHELRTESDDQNFTTGPVFTHETKGTYARSEGPVLSISGVSDLIVVATTDEVMITPKGHDAAAKILGKEVQSNRARFGISAEIQSTVQAWLWEAFEVWSHKAWDSKNGGFVEQLDLNGTPDTRVDRRVRVQARQVYSFAQAVEIGWSGESKAKNIVDQGLRYIDSQLRHPEGGWIHIVSAEGKPVDDRRDLYDHAFMILAGSAAYKATGNLLGLRIAEDALAFIETALKEPTHGGWLEGVPTTPSRRANPHMHLLEAMLAYHDATGDDRALKHAKESVRLFETFFFDPSTDVMAEFFEENWKASDAPDQVEFEPGHHYEWAALLSMFETATGHDTLSWRRRLIRRADQSGLNPATGFAMNALRANGEITNPNSRLWHQLEMFRAYMLHPDVASRSKAERLLERIFEEYLNPGPKGGWIDELDVDGKPIATAVPASLLYHAVTAFKPLI